MSPRVSQPPRFLCDWHQYLIHFRLRKRTSQSELWRLPIVLVSLSKFYRGGSKSLSIKQIAFRSHIIIISFHSFHPNRFSYFSCKSNIFLRNQQIKPRKFCRLRFICYFCSGITKKSPVTDVNTQSWTQHIADMIF